MIYSTLNTTRNNDKSINHKNINSLIAYAQLRKGNALHWSDRDYWIFRIKLLEKFKTRILAEKLKYENAALKIED